MSITDWGVRIIAFVIVVLGFLLLLAALGVASGVHVPLTWWLEGLVGLGLIGIGIIILRGGKVTA